MNSDFADLRAVLEDAGEAVVGSSQCGGSEAAVEAAREAIGNLMVEAGSLPKVGKVLINVTGSSQFGMHDANQALHLIHRELDHDANVIIGTVRDDSLEDQVRVMVIASGFQKSDFELQSAEEESVTEDSSTVNGSSHWTSDHFTHPFAEERAEPPIVVAEERAERMPVSAEPEPVPVAEAEALPRDEEKAEVELPTNGVPLEFVPPPPIRIGETDGQDRPAAKKGFFRRKSIFS